MAANNLQKDTASPVEYTPYGVGIPPSQYGYLLPEPELNILDYWRVIWKRKWLIFLITLLFGVSAYGISIWSPKKYKTQATLMPLTSSGSGGLSNLASQVSSLPMVGSQLASLGALGGGKSKELVNILKSRTLTEKIIDKFDLMKVIYSKQYDPATGSYSPNWLGVVPVKEDAINVFQKKISKIEEDKKTGLIKMEIQMKDPLLAAQVANEMIAQLQSFIENNSLTLSKRNRIFIEQQLVKNGAKLLEAGKELNNFFANNRISSVSPQLDVDVGSFEKLPKLFEEFRSDIQGAQGDVGAADKSREGSARVGRVPGQIYLQYLTLKRELIAKVHALLTQQYEMAKIEEAKEDLAFQVIDKAEVKVRTSSPNLLINLAVGIFGGICVSVFLAFFLEHIKNLQAKERL